MHPAIVVLEPLALDKQLFTLAASLPNVWIVQTSPMVRVLTTCFHFIPVKECGRSEYRLSCCDIPGSKRPWYLRPLCAGVTRAPPLCRMI